MKALARRIAPLLLTAVAASAWAQKTELLVYTALETDQLKAYTESFQKTNPNIDLKFVRDSTGVITAKVLAEKANPQADISSACRRPRWRSSRPRACSRRTPRSASPP